MNRNNLSLRLCAALILSSMLLFTACKKYDTAFQQSPDERIATALQNYQSALTSSPAGWNATIRTQSGGIYHFHFRFNDSNRVKMYSDFNLSTASTAGESSYRLKALQTPSLLFDTYSYLHMLSDPDGSVNGGNNGAGLGSDFEFSLDSLAKDSILCTGRVNGTKMTLIRATQQDFDAWQNGRWATTLGFENINSILNYFRRLTVGAVNYEVRVNTVTRTVTFTWVDANGNNQQFSTPYYYSSTSVVLVNPFTAGTQTINSIDIVSWDATNFVLNVKVNGTVGTIAGATKPLKVDLAAPQRWWQTAASTGGYWVSPDGFHVNGVDDAFGVKTLANYYFLVYWPGYNGNSNDLFAPVFINAAGTGLELLYGAAPKAQFTADGRAIFTNLGSYGTYPSSGPARQSLTQLLLPQGYYFVQTSATTYDMVSSTDAKAWISMQLVP
ncbi:MAG: DUF4302 domain-containing protein [Flavisolibacter sp.]